MRIEDAEAIRREVPSVTAVSEEVPSTAQVAAGNQNWFTRVMGESPDYFDIRQWLLAEGAPFTAQEVRSSNKLCVIGQTTATQVFGNDDPVGQTLRIKNVPFIVSGVLTPKGLSIQGTDQDDVVVMPYTSAMKRVAGGTTLRNINVQGQMRPISNRRSSKSPPCYASDTTSGPVAMTTLPCAINRKLRRRQRRRPTSWLDCSVQLRAYRWWLEASVL